MLNGNRQQGASAHTAARWRGIWRKPVILSVIVATLSLVVCSSSEDPTSTPTAAEPSGPKIGGTLVMATAHPQSLNPILWAVSTSIYSPPLFFNGLTRPDDDLGPLPDLAESWDVSADGLIYTFRLRNGVKWHDGQLFTAKDVKFTWESICHSDNARARQLCSFFSRVKGAREFTAGDATEIVGIKILDDQTVQVEMTDMYAPFLTLSAGQMIIPKHLWGNVPVKEFGAHPAARGDGTIGTGPFVVDSWTANESIVAHANEDYHFGRPNLDQFIIRQASSATAQTTISQLKVGEVDVMGLFGSLPIDNVQEIEADPSLEIRRVTGFSNMYVELNLASPFFQDVRARKALSYATNRKELEDNLWLGRATFINGPVHPFFDFAASPDIPLFDNDLDKARDLFAKAGWTPGSDGILQKDGQKFSFKMQTIQRDYPPVLQQQWKRVGVEMEIELMDFGSWNPIYRSGKFDLVGSNRPMGLPIDADYYMPRYSSTQCVNNCENAPNQSRTDELIGLSTGSLDLKERQKHYYEFQEVFANDVTILWLGIPDNHWAFNKDLVIPEKKAGVLMLRAAKDWYWNK